MNRVKFIEVFSRQINIGICNWMDIKFNNNFKRGNNRHLSNFKGLFVVLQECVTRIERGLNTLKQNYMTHDVFTWCRIYINQCVSINKNVKRGILMESCDLEFSFKENWLNLNFEIEKQWRSHCPRFCFIKTFIFSNTSNLHGVCAFRVVNP